MKFLMLHYFDESDLGTPDDQGVTEPLGPDVQAWVDEVTAAGVKLDGARLRPVRDAVTLRIRAEERLLSDGPFAETKEQIAGFDVLECDSLAEAVEVAYRHPSARGGTLELRPFLE